MDEEKLQETEEGYYVQNGDVLEWRWNKGKEPDVSVPKGEFDPRAVEPEPEPKAAPKKVETKAEKKK